MGRSVSTPSDAVEVLYLDWMSGHEDEDGNEIDAFDTDYWEHEWEYLTDDDFIGNVLQPLFPSVYPHEDWVGREDRVVAMNDHAYFGVSEYCGLAAFWVMVNPDQEREGLALHWIEQAWPKIEAMYPHRLTLMGRFSNGEAVYQRAES